MKTRITELLGIDHPIVCPGMTYVSTAELVAAAGEAGALGILAVGHLSPEQTRAEIERVRALTDAPFGVGVALIMPGARANAEVVLEQRVPVINFSLGKGGALSERAHAYGAKVIATVVNRKHAIAAEQDGADALLVTGHEAAAHGGEVTSLVLVQALRRVSSLPIIAAGGFSTGQSLVAALALGADAVAMGTRFLATKESPVHPRTKAAVFARDESETIYTANFDGMPCRIMKTEHATAITRRKLSPMVAAARAVRAARELEVSFDSVARELAQQGPRGAVVLAYFGAATASIRRAIRDGDLERGVELIGQAQGLIDDAPTCAELVSRILEEADAATARVAASH